MTSKRGSDQKPKSELHGRLGDELHRIRSQAGKTTRQIGDFSSTQVSRVENGLADCSEDFLAEYIKLGGDRVRLLSMRDDIIRASAQHRREQRLKGKEVKAQTIIDTQALTPDSDFHELRRLYRTEELADHYLIGPTRSVQRATHIVRVRPLTRHSRYYVCSYSLGDAGRQGCLTIQPGQGCELARLTETDRGVLHFVLDFNPSGGTAEERLYEFTFTIDFHIDDPMTRRPMLRNSTRSGVRRVMKRVQFSEPALPSRIWWFCEIELLETEDEPPTERLLPLNSSGLYSHEFSDLVDEYVGLGWEWRE